MAEAMIQGMLAQQVARAEQIVVADVAESRRTLLFEKFAVGVTGDNLDAVGGAAVIVLAVKPQQLSIVLDELRGRIPSGALVISIVAGARIETLCTRLQHRQLVRAMPNTPAKVSMGATVWAASGEVSAAQLKLAQTVLAAMGLDLMGPNESFVEMATGLTGATPAFIFLMVEALVETGVSLGFSQEQALALTIQTFQGSVELLKRSGEHPAVLRGQVTSPGGATLAGLQELERLGMRAAVREAVYAVYRRAQELGRIEPPQR